MVQWFWITGKVVWVVIGGDDDEVDGENEGAELLGVVPILGILLDDITGCLLSS